MPVCCCRLHCVYSWIRLPLETGISWWKSRRREQWKYILFCWQCSSSLPLREPVVFTLSYLTDMYNDQRMPEYRWKPLLVCIIMITVILSTLAIYGDGKVGGTCFAPKLEDTEHDDVPSRCSGVGAAYQRETSSLLTSLTT